MPTLTVLGATGTQGASVIDAFRPLMPTWTIRAITRNPASPAAQALQSSGIEVMKADASDATSLTTAFANTTAIFAVTDYWAPFSHPTPSKPAHQSLRHYAYETEIAHGRNIADAASRIPTLTHFIWSGLPSPKKWSKGKYDGVLHFDSKGMITEYIRERHPELARRMSVVYVGFYVSNLLAFELMRPRKTPEGFVFERLCNGQVKHPFIIAGKETGPFVRALVEAPPGKVLLAYTAMLNFDELAAMWSWATGQPARHRQVSMAEVKERFPEAGEETDSTSYSAEFGYAGGDPSVFGPEELGFRDRPEDVEEWMREQDWSSVIRAGADKKL